MSAEPTFATRRNPRRRSWGGAVADIADALTGSRLPWQRRIGSPLMPWQQMVSDVTTEVDDAGALWYRTVIITVQRQAGKTTALRPIMAQKAQQGRAVWFTAQTRSHARKRWVDLTAPIASALGRGVVKHNIGVGAESLRWVGSGGGVFPFAPNETGMHGETPDDVMTDEAWKFTMDQAAAMQGGYEFGFATKADPQDWMLSTQGTEDSEWFALLTETGRAAVADPFSRTAYFEWSIPETVGGVPAALLPDADLLELVFAHHPADGFTLQRDRVSDTLGKVHEGRVSRAEFVRGYGNLPTGRPQIGSGVWPGAVWSTARTDLAPVGAVGFGIDVDPDGREWSLVAAGRASSGQTVLEVIVRRDGAPGPVDAAYVRERVDVSRPVALHMIGAGAAADFADLLAGAGVAVERITAGDLGAAVARMLRGVEQLQILHRGQPSLDEAQRAAVVRSSGERRLFARAGAAGVSALQAGMLAAWALDHPADVARGPFRIFTPRSA